MTITPAPAPQWLAPLPLPGRPQGVRAVHTLRGPVTPGNPYSGVNLCHYVADDPDHVERSRHEFCRALGLSSDRLVVPRQTHSVRVAVTDSLPAAPEDVDAVVTNLADVAIGVSTADCVPVVLADAEAGVIAALHAGWRGALGGIVANTVAAMVQLGATPTRISASLGPCICADCFEVGEEVATLFPDEVVRRANGIKPHVDLPAYVMAQLADAGVGRSRIAPPPLCTRCHPDLLFSARAHGTASGRIFTAIMQSRRPL